MSTHLVWNKRNSIEHNRSSHGLNAVENIRLEKAVKLQYRLGTTGLLATAAYLFRTSILDLLAHDNACIRTWLATVLLARGQINASKRELQSSRGLIGYVRSRPTEMEQCACQISRHRANCEEISIP